MNIFILFFISLTLGAATIKEIEEAKQSIRSLIRPLIPGSDKTPPKELGGFRVEGCEKHKIDWMGVLLMRTKAKLDYHFKEGCDIEGTITPAVFSPFPAKLKLRQLESYDLIETQNKITATLESKPVMNLEMREGVLTGKKGKVKFEADYEVVLNPMNKDQIVEKNRGGEIRISEIYGKKIAIKEKILVE
jgi:hypothetical protein